MGTSKQKNYYEMLGVQRDATKKEIKTAYRDIALAYHPDSNFFDEIVNDEKLSEEQQSVFKSLTAAYHTLMDEGSRTRYDETLPPRIRGWGEPSKSTRVKESFHYEHKKDIPEATRANFGRIDNTRKFQDEPGDPSVQTVRELLQKPNPIVEALSPIIEWINKMADQIELALKKRRGFK